MDAGAANLIFADPPYGVRYSNRSGQTILGDSAPWIWWLHEAARVLRDDGGLLCCTRYDVLPVWLPAIACAGLRVRSCIVWDKCSHGMGNTRQAVAPQHELILWATKHGYAFPAGRPADVIRVPKVPGALMQHPTEKPVALYSQLIEATTRPGDLVVDPFCGSGTCVVAAIETGRDWIAAELDQHHYRTARRRILAARQERP